MLYFQEPIKINQLDKFLLTALHVAVQQRNAAIAELLLNHGALIDLYVVKIFTYACANTWPALR